jgi:hypothetical protein
MSHQAMISKVAHEFRRRFNSHKAAAEACTKPVPPRVEVHLARLAIKAAEYKNVTPVPGTNDMEWNVSSRTGVRSYHVVLSAVPQTPPTCCAYSQVDDGFLCYHGAAVVSAKHGTRCLHKFIAQRHLTEAWQDMYDGVQFRVPEQWEIDEVILAAKESVESGTGLKPPKALYAPRGAPGKEAGKRKEDWLQKGAGNKKRKYTCALCHLAGHTRKDCELRQCADDAGDDSV